MDIERFSSTSSQAGFILTVLIEELKSAISNLFETAAIPVANELEKDNKSFGYNTIYFELVHL